jgi:hypothetical protein
MRWAWSPEWGRDHAHRQLHEQVPRLTASRLSAQRRARWEIPASAAHISHVGDDPGTGMGSPWNQRQAQDADVGEGRDAAGPGPARSRASGRSVMRRTRIRRSRVRSKRPWLEALSPDPRDPDVVRGQGTRADHAFQPGAGKCPPGRGRARLAVQTVIREARTANNEQVYTWECVLLTRKAAPVTATGPLRWVSSPDPRCWRSAVVSLVWL